MRLRDWMRASGNGPLRFVWKASYAGLRAAMTWGLRAAAPGSTIFARGTFGEGRPLYGYSDLDLVAVAPDAERAQLLRRRVGRVLRRLPVTRHAVDVAVTTRAELERNSTIPFVCQQAPARTPAAAQLPRGFGISFIGRTRPWRRLGGRRMADLGPVPREFRLQWIWAEAQFRWKHVVRSVLGSGDPLQAAHVASGALMGLAQAMAWAESGDEPTPLEQAVAAAITPAPEHAAALRAALDHCSGHLPPEPLVVLPAMAALTHVIAGRIDSATTETTAVRLIGAIDADAEAPLLDWRSLPFPSDDRETLSARADSLANLRSLQASATRDTNERTALLDGRVLLMPIQPGSLADRFSSQAWVMRSVQCAVSDPVSWALARGESTAMFGDLAGWSLSDWAGRAAAELALRLEERAFSDADLRRQRARLTAAARLLALRESMAEGRPELRVSTDAVLAWLDEERISGRWLDDRNEDADLEPSRRALARKLDLHAAPQRSV